MYQNYIFDLYGTLVDIHTNEKKAYLWKKMSLFFGMKGAAYEPKELRMAYETKIKEQEAALRMECRGSHVPEIDIADVFRQLFEDQAVSVTEEEIADLAKMFRVISIEELKLFPGVPEMLQRLKDAGKKVFLLSNAQALFTAPEISLLGLTKYFDGILLSSDAGVKKPDPAFYEMLLKQYHLDPAECLMTGNDDILLLCMILAFLHLQKADPLCILRIADQIQCHLIKDNIDSKNQDQRQEMIADVKGEDPVYMHGLIVLGLANHIHTEIGRASCRERV